MGKQNRVYLSPETYSAVRKWGREFGKAHLENLMGAKSRIFMGLDDNIHALEYEQRVRLHRILDHLERACLELDGFIDNCK